jgi:hypothetical protein
VLRECFDTAREQLAQLSLLGITQTAEHPLLHCPHRGTRGAQLLTAARRQLGRQHAPRWGSVRSGDEPLAFHRLQERVHRLARDERAAGEFGIRQTWALRE